MKKREAKGRHIITKRDAHVQGAQTLVADLKQMIEAARSAVAVAVNVGLTILY
jgi:hypothetical protein